MKIVFKNTEEHEEEEFEGANGWMGNPWTVEPLGFPSNSTTGDLSKLHMKLENDRLEIFNDASHSTGSTR